MNTRKYPRTLNEAFGPYSGRLYAKTEPLHRNDCIVLIGSAVAGLFVAAVMVLS